MRRVSVVCVGRLKEKFYVDAAGEYAKRLGRYCKLELVELPEQRLPDSPSPAVVEKALAKEAEAIRNKLPAGACTAALCVEGRMLSSQQFSTFLSGSIDAPLAFIIGGSYGLHSSVKDAAAFRLSMSPMTFPHHLARVMLLEQLYRGFQIMEGGKYHK